MTVEISPVYLYDLHKSEPVEAELWDQITDRQLADWENDWSKGLLDGMSRLNDKGVLVQKWPQSAHWEWDRKVSELRGLLSQTGFSVMCADMTQGMMIVNCASHRCRLGGQEGQHLVYVEYVENAPWNRAELLGSPRYKGVGSLLMGAAIQLSIAEGFQGRVGLHSLPQADSWYGRSCGMTDLGADGAKQGLRYFEMTAAQAQAFIAKGY